MNKRFWEIDTLRGIAIINMLISNWAFTLKFLNIFTVATGWLFWILYPRLIAGTFLFLVGISLTLSYNKIKNKGRKFIYFKFIKRGLMLFSWGILITIVTWLLIPKYFILFGVLHLIGISTILSMPFLESKNLSLLSGLTIIFIGMQLQNMRFNFSWFSWLGLIPNGFATIDHFPIFPWFGIILIGIFIGNTFYENGKRKFKLSDLSENILIRAFSFLGRVSLKIYLIHQPLLILILMLLGFRLF